MAEKIKTRDYLKKRMLWRLRIFYVISLLMFGFVIYEILEGYIEFLLALTAMLLGILTGWLAAKRYKIMWHEETEKVINKMDTIGIIILVLYIGFTISREWIFHHWLKGEALSAFTLTFANGAMMARVVSLRKKIRAVIFEQKRS